jgi:isochorismate synthase
MDEKWANTLSLAGTQASTQIKWNPKEIEEQKIVSDYIEEMLHSLGIENFKKEKTVTQAAGNVVHLSAKFQFSKVYLQDRLAQFLSGLHPTPAVCGLPKDRALNLIMNTEKHKREYYSGYCGILNPKGNTDLFVNLRCMKILPDKLALFVGGGLTAQSVAKDEWEETVLKSQTLLQLL